jgi:hypothetical protein
MHFQSCLPAAVALPLHFPQAQEHQQRQWTCSLALPLKLMSLPLLLLLLLLLFQGYLSAAGPHGC